MNADRKEFERMKPIFLNQLERKECFNCGTASEPFEVHHIVPLASGGTNRLTNLSLLCVACHGLVHDADFVSMRNLSKAGRKRANWIRIIEKPTPRTYKEIELFASTLIKNKIYPQSVDKYINDFANSEEEKELVSEIYDYHWNECVRESMKIFGGL